MSERRYCPHCEEAAVLPCGPKNSPILLLGEFPGEAELNFGVPFCGPTGKVLKAELGKVGLDYRSCRISNLWIHAPTDSEECKNLSMKVALRECEGRKGILLIGSDCAKTFVRKGVMEIAGLRVEEDVTLIHAPVIVCIPNPASVFKTGGVVGEVRLGIERFAEAIEPYMED